MHNLHKSRRTARRVVSVFVFVFMLAVTANAYTVVMRGGRRVEIPSQFVVTGSTLTYETAPGVQITLQMSAIDIAATERANSEQPGSLLRRGQLTASSSSMSEGENTTQVAQATSARRTITNRDLQSAMQRRRESELAYESRRKQLGLPSVEASRRQAAAAADAIGIDLAQRRGAEKESEDYWRGRASELRTEMAALDAEIGWIGGRLDEGPFPMSSGWANGSTTTVTSVEPFSTFGNFGRRSYGNYGGGRYNRQDGRRATVFVAPGQDGRQAGRVPYWRGSRRGQRTFNRGGFPYGYPPGLGSGFPTYPGVSVFGSAVPEYDSSYERGELITHFNELAAKRAGLNARWRQLEEEARRAGAPPGWLRP